MTVTSADRVLGTRVHIKESGLRPQQFRDILGMNHKCVNEIMKKVPLNTDAGRDIIISELSEILCNIPQYLG